jgi:nucleotide-binding universal stress UspA family protein
MYRRVLVALEHTPYDEHIIDHVRRLAGALGSRLLFIHVADGWVARNFRQLDLRESEEMQQDRSYLEQVCERLEADGIECDAVLASGDPAKEISEAAEREQCDLIAMATHGHGFINDVVRGSVANEVRHMSMIPVLLVRAPRPAARASGESATAPGQ